MLSRTTTLANKIDAATIRREMLKIIPTYPCNSFLKQLVYTLQAAHKVYVAARHRSIEFNMGGDRGNNPVHLGFYAFFFFF